MQMVRSYLAYKYDGDQPENVDEEHILHCFDYVRVALMCYGDTALVGADPGDAGLNGTRGWGVTHVCKSWDALYDMAVARAAELTHKGFELGIFHITPSPDPRTLDRRPEDPRA
ncbi:hypothetical protein CLAFUW4_08307 [Fulvia fulva]|uniref:Uncharacterized protein n=1 Tax=Passalora fulva TaxID=5499 RepID=A0A9Q8P730_PASFU|nr:uncharacterized protein CLAFUR5_08415 [Fulvia fulva]KAK4629648.1 hypothetical protein CLAFUR4_08312 [Fulvia fulva]KAK4629766.1 hypothetical protein CLAFUR0_08307 [Fulvia fulva]UJO15586.1 hypothetical protein CLAFUR5_08415 [Fulvia fulva]WPV12527.1 hypothetical protein CLAFUW4_08307 [Fulvia fulva]WPV27361.1 hypothetical protein CLAFUW7_08307 [Fulvia fulva]